MKKLGKISAVAAVLSLSSSLALAAAEMEQCKVVDKAGKGLIKANKADCAAASHTCAGQNKAGDSVSWIMVPKGECEKINTGDFGGVSQEIKDKIDGA